MLSQVNQFNLMASEMISLNRSLQDVRLSACKNKVLFSEDLTGITISDSLPSSWGFSTYIPLWPGVRQFITHHLCSHCLPQWGLDHTPKNGKFWMSQNLNFIIHLSDLANSGSFHYQSVTCGACGGDYSGGRRQWARSSWIWPGGLCEEPSPTCIRPQNWCSIRSHKGKVGKPPR